MIKEDLFTWRFTYRRTVELAMQKRARELSMQKSTPQQVIPLDDAKKVFLHILRDTPQLISQLEQTPSGESYISQILTHRLSSRWDDPAFSWATWRHNKHVAVQKATGRFGGKETKALGSDWPSGQANKHALDRNHQAHKDVSTYKWKALMATYDVRSLLAKTEADLSSAELLAKDIIMGLKEEGENEQRVGKQFGIALRKLVPFYDIVKWPNGLRFHGDSGGPMPDPDPYRDCPHPAVSLFKSLGSKETRQRRFAQFGL